MTVQAVLNHTSCCNTKCMLFWASLAAAVAGVAMSILESAIYGIIGFALMGLVSFFFYHMNNRELEELNAQAEKNISQMDGQVKQMETQTKQMTQNRADMQVQIDTLSKDVAAREKVQAQLENQLKRLSEQYTALEQTKVALDKDLGLMKENGQKLQDEIRALAQHKLELGEQVGAFGQGVAELEKHKAAMVAAQEKMQQQFSGDFEQLSGQLAIVRQASVDISTKVNADNTKLQETLSNSIASNQRLEAQLEETEKRIREEKIEIKRQADDLRKQQALIVAQLQEVADKRAEFIQLQAETVSKIGEMLKK